MVHKRPESIIKLKEYANSFGYKILAEGIAEDIPKIICSKQSTYCTISVVTLSFVDEHIMETAYTYLFKDWL